VAGPTLEALLKDGVTQDWDIGRTLDLFRQILSGLDYAHSKGVIHRDVKSSNVLVAEGDLVKLTDFGIALLIGDKRLTASQSTVGTPTYMSPEQILRPRLVDHRSDVYSAAIVLYEMLAGRPPFEAETEYELKKLQIEAPVPDVRILNPRVPAAVAEAITTALRKNPEERFQSAGAFLRALPTQAAPVTNLTAIPEASTPAPSKLFLPRWKRWAVAAALVLLLGIPLWALLQPRREEPLRQEPAVAAAEKDSMVAPAEMPTTEDLTAPLVSQAEETPDLPSSPPPSVKDSSLSEPSEPTRRAAEEKTEEKAEPARERESQLQAARNEMPQEDRSKSRDLTETPPATPATSEPEPTDSPARELIEERREPGPSERHIVRKLIITGVEINPQLVTRHGRAVAVAHVSVNPPFDQPATVNVRARVMQSLREIAAPIVQTVMVPAGGGTWRITIPIKITRDVPPGGCYVDIELLEPTQQVKGTGRIGFTIQ
jgi:serine/threonine protein kinase